MKYSKESVVDHLNSLSEEDVLDVLRSSDLLATLGPSCKAISNARVDFHLNAALVYAKRQHAQVLAEAEDLDAILSTIGVSPVFLKGAAYCLADDRNSNGRLMSDIDILVPKNKLSDVENALKREGWQEKAVSDYDDQYYRQWSHELPPFFHPERGTTLDIHHTLIPPISGKCISDSLLWKHTEVNGGLYTLDLEMRLVHCIVHFLVNEDFNKASRDVWDLFCLVHQASDAGKLAAVEAIMRESQLQREFALAVNLVGLNEGMRPMRMGQKLTLGWLRKLSLPAIQRKQSMRYQFSIFALYVRGHLVKMPLRVLLPHTLHKLRRAIVMLVMGKHHYD